MSTVPMSAAETAFFIVGIISTGLLALGHPSVINPLASAVARKHYPWHPGCSKPDRHVRRLALFLALSFCPLPSVLKLLVIKKSKSRSICPLVLVNRHSLSESQLINLSNDRNLALLVIREPCPKRCRKHLNPHIPTGRIKSHPCFDSRLLNPPTNVSRHFFVRHHGSHYIQLFTFVNSYFNLHGIIF